MAKKKVRRKKVAATVAKSVATNGAARPKVNLTARDKKTMKSLV